MKLNNSKNIATIICIILLCLATVKGLPYGYFTILRLAVFATSVYLTWLAFRIKKEAWGWAFAFVVLLFNPLFPVHLGKDLWTVIDLGVAVFFASSIFGLKLAKEIETK